MNTAIPWILWTCLSLGLIGYFTYRLNSQNQDVFLPGSSTDGHYQIELACSACHTPMMGVKEQACLDCHGADLDEAKDSHPKKKFTDPRNATQLEKLDARRCITCHIEHRTERTKAMGLTIPEDYCLYCHENIADERPSHKEFNFLSCATAGCHNFHDNTALYEDFLAKHFDEPMVKSEQIILQRDLKTRLLKTEVIAFLKPLKTEDADIPPKLSFASAPQQSEWTETSHARAGINCSNCHQPDPEGIRGAWTDQVNHTSCQACHASETQGWLRGKHGMRHAQELPPMNPKEARLPMKSSAKHENLSCVSCHSAHTFNTEEAAVHSCMKCHDDEHSNNYFNSPHYQLFVQEGDAPEPTTRGVSCATCHLPRVVRNIDGKDWVHVEHNQNWNLEPNEKMIRSVCLNCHGLGFSIDALADPELIQSNFQGQPSQHIESIDLVKRRLEETPN